MEMRYLVYTSRLVDHRGPAAVPAIIRAARANNAIRGITGGLMFDGERFCQYIEGPADEIVRTFTAIQHDDRHVELELLASSSVTQRRFGQWTMAYVYAVTPELIDEIGHQAVGEVAAAFQGALAKCGPEV